MDFDDFLGDPSEQSPEEAKSKLMQVGAIMMMTATDDPEDSLLLSLTQLDVSVIMMGLISSDLFRTVEGKTLLTKMKECMDVQKPREDQE